MSGKMVPFRLVQLSFFNIRWRRFNLLSIFVVYFLHALILFYSFFFCKFLEILCSSSVVIYLYVLIEYFESFNLIFKPLKGRYTFGDYSKQILTSKLTLKRVLESC